MEFLQDLRYGARLFAKSPGFAAIAIVTLALGIAGNATIFTCTKSIVFLLPPVEKAGQMARLFASGSSNREERTLPSLSDFLDWQQQSRSFSGIAATSWASYRVTTNSGESARLETTLVSPGYLAMLRVAPAMGRDFTEQDSQPGAPAVAILGHAVWQTQFGAIAASSAALFCS